MNRTVLKRLLQYTKPYRKYLILSILCAILNVAFTLYVPVLIGKAIDQMLSAGNVLFSGLWRILIILAITIASASWFNWLLSYFTNLITFRTVKDLRIGLFQKFMRVPLKMIDTHAHGDLISRLVNDIDQVSDGLLQGFTQLLTGIMTILGTLLFMLFANVWITLLVVVMTPLSLFVAAFIAKKTFRHFKAQSKTQGELSAFIAERVGNQKLMISFAREEVNEEQFDEINARLYTEGQKAQFASSLSNPCTRFVNGLVYAAVGIAGAISAINGHISVGQISMFLSYANQYTKPFNEITGIITQLQSAIAAAERVFDVLDEEEEKPEEHAHLPQGECEIHFCNVNFGYQSTRRIIEDFNLIVSPGMRVAIVGPTGCGKTTLINLIMRFYDVNAGKILLDGVDIRKLPRAELRSHFGMVLQDSWLFTGTVRENIAYGRPDATDEQIEAAARAAHAESFIRRLPQGYDTMIEQDGGNLSQGQRQLLCIARVMLVDPPMLILDEATSNIDTRTEALVQSAFTKMMQGRTSIVVAHRLSTICEADIILAMRDGKIVESGRHGELLSQNGFYADLYYSQFKGEKV